MVTFDMVGEWKMSLMNRRNFLRATVGSTVLGTLVVGNASAVHQTWKAKLEPVSGTGSNANGSATFKYAHPSPGATERMEFGLQAAALSSDVIAAHIHHIDPTGSVIVGLHPANTRKTRQRGRAFVAGGRFGDDDVSIGDLEALIDEIDNGGEYVRVHTSDNPGGELVGEIS